MKQTGRKIRYRLEVLKKSCLIVQINEQVPKFADECDFILRQAIKFDSCMRFCRMCFCLLHSLRRIYLHTDKKQFVTSQESLASPQKYNVFFQISYGSKVTGLRFNEFLKKEP